MRHMPQIILCLWGFLCVRDAGRTGNKISVEHIWRRLYNRIYFLFTGRWAYNWGGGRALMTRGAYRVVSKGQGAFFPGYYKHDPHLLL